MLKTIEIDYIYQPLIDAPPIPMEVMWQQACAGDKTTVESWRPTWIENFKKNKQHFGDFGPHSYGKLYGINRHKPAIVIGSGPSLKNSVDALIENKRMKHPVLTISALHNFGYFQDLSDEHGINVHADYYMSLDSGKIVLGDVHESCKREPEYYWEKSKGHKLIAYVASDTGLFESWKGEVYLFNCLLPDMELRAELNNIERFSNYISSGGNCSGACMYTAKAVMGSNPILYVGVDFCFDYNNTFHSYKTHYDTLGEYVLHPDCHGVPRKTWRSYLAFKFAVDTFALSIPGDWISCSDGLVGAYREGNIRAFKYMPLSQALLPYWMSERIFVGVKDKDGKVVGEPKKVELEDMFSNPKFEDDLVCF